jgi:dipeptidyl aminopeptidase/acylaminoacyl peptidase
MRYSTQLSLALTLVATAAVAQDKPALDHAAYEEWHTIEDATLSGDGTWLLYRLTLQDGDPELRVRNVTMRTEHVVPRADEARFTHDARFVVMTIRPALDSVRAARRAKRDDDELPKDTLGILDLTSGDVVRFAAVESFAVPTEGGEWIAILLEAAVDSGAAQGSVEDPKDEPSAENGNELVLYHPAEKRERRVEGVTAYLLAEDGKRVVYAVSGVDSASHGVWLVAPGEDEAVPVLAGSGDYRSFAFDDAGAQLAFLASTGDEKPRRWAVHRWRDGDATARPVVPMEGRTGTPDGWVVSGDRPPAFSPNGARLFFGTAPAPPREDTDSLTDDERVVVDIWHWRDPYLQPQQQEQLDEERKRSYLAVFELRRDRLIQLASEDLPDIALGRDGDADVALGESGLAYRRRGSWDTPRYRDVYLVDLRTGERELLLQETQANPSLSPDGSYVYWYDYATQGWQARAVRGGPVEALTASIPYPLYDEEHDTPSPPPPYGSAGWTSDDGGFLVYDRYDIWWTDPTGKRPARPITEGVGRRDSTRLRYARLDPEVDAIDPDAAIVLTAFHYHSKASGVYRDRVTGDAPPERLVFEDRRYELLGRAKNAERILFTRQDVAEFPDLWVSDPDWSSPIRLSDANPQQSRYRWATVELVEWISGDGVRLQGLVYKPEDFDPEQQYPLMVNFYERDSDNLHTHFPPIPHRSVVRPVFYASRGYIVFMPDIVYREGYPGESALDAVVPGVLQLLEEGYIDRARIGIQGHSWGGYQIAYIVTKTDLFRAAAAGAPVSNMISAYGGIRWGSGMSRMFQYERTQSRIGATLWEAPVRYIENSPIFWADRIETPLLIMHNDRDGAVPWYQGIELFVALRRLGKPAWLVNYNDAPHWPVTFAEKRDWNIRLQQYFDHYLLAAPAPVWLAEGIPAIDKGRTLGLEPLQPERERP